jgi:dTDP-glucose 4,6-dehydratase
MFALAYHKTFKLNVSITRCTNNFGAHQLPEKTHPKNNNPALKDLSIPVYGTGTTFETGLRARPLRRGGDVLEKGEAGEIYNVSAGNEATTIEIVKRILALLGKPEDLLL